MSDTARAPAAPLAGRRIVVTRPERQAGPLADAVRAAGGEPVLFPVIEILDAPDLAPIHALIDRLETYDFAIFISPNAVHKAINLILARRPLPARPRFVAIGRASRRELERCGATGVLAPERGADSEALLALPELADVAGRRVVIFRGDGGRELLGDTLTARGAMVEYAECYRRSRTGADTAPLMKMWARNEIDGIVVTSSEAVRHLYDLVGKLGQSWLRTTPVFVPHPRIAETARSLGLERVVQTGAGDEGLIAGLIAHFGAPRDDARNDARTDSR